MKEKWEPNPPDVQTVAIRALNLGALVMRGVFEQMVQVTADSSAVSDYEDSVSQLEAWLKNEGLVAYQSKQEKAVFQKEVGTWSQREIVNVSWRAEALGVIMWALFLHQAIPPYDTLFDLEEIVAPLNLFDYGGYFLLEAQLRPHEMVLYERHTAELWHWRSRTTQLQRMGAKPPGGLTFESIIRGTAEEGHAQGSIPPPIDGDFPAFGKPYAALSDQEFSRATSIAVERHFALNWLCGYAASDAEDGAKGWDETPTNT